MVLPILFTRGAALQRLQIQSGRLTGRAPTDIQSKELHLIAFLSALDAKTIADPHQMRGLYGMSIAMHLSAPHRLGGQRTGLEKARGPQPAVDADAVGQPPCPLSSALTRRT